MNSKGLNSCRSEAEDRHYMQLALKQAELAQSQGEVPVGALIVRGQEIIGVGFNQRESTVNPTSHAEILAIEEASRVLKSWRLENCSLYVTLEPCVMCLGACVQSRIFRVVYGARDPKGGAESLGYGFNRDVRLNHRFDLVSFDFPPASLILSAFFQERRAAKKDPK